MSGELLLAAVVIGALLVLLVLTSRRYGRPRLYMSPVVALWVIAALLASTILWLSLT